MLLTKLSVACGIVLFSFSINGMVVAFDVASMPKSLCLMLASALGAGDSNDRINEERSIEIRLCKAKTHNMNNKVKNVVDCLDGMARLQQQIMHSRFAIRD
jgi:hypothetical protein